MTDSQTPPDLSEIKRQAAIGMGYSILNAPFHEESTAALRTPKDYGMDYEDIRLPALVDECEIAAWYIKAKKTSDGSRLAIVGHQTWTPANKSGMVENHTEGQLQIAIDYVKLHKVLHDAGFHVLAYDLRNHGESEHRLPSGFGAIEYRDAAGVMDWVNSHETLKECDVLLLPFCASGNAFLKANSLYPEKFTNVKAWATTNIFQGTKISCDNPTPFNPEHKGFFTAEDINGGFKHVFDEHVEKKNITDTTDVAPFTIERMSAKLYASNVKVPVLFCDPKNDTAFNHVNDAPETFAEFPSKESEFHWIGTDQEGPFKTETDNRCEGYNFYQSDGGKGVLLDFVNKHIPSIAAKTVFENGRGSNSRKKAEESEVGDAIQRLQNLEASLEHSLQSNLKAIIGEDDSDSDEDDDDDDNDITDDDHTDDGDGLFFLKMNKEIKDEAINGGPTLSPAEQIEMPNKHAEEFKTDYNDEALHHGPILSPAEQIEVLNERVGILNNQNQMLTQRVEDLNNQIEILSSKMSGNSGVREIFEPEIVEDEEFSSVTVTSGYTQAEIKKDATAHHIESLLEPVEVGFDKPRKSVDPGKNDATPYHIESLLEPLEAGLNKPRESVDIVEDAKDEEFSAAPSEKRVVAKHSEAVLKNHMTAYHIDNLLAPLEKGFRPRKFVAIPEGSVTTEDHIKKLYDPIKTVPTVTQKVLDDDEVSLDLSTSEVVTKLAKTLDATDPEAEQDTDKRKKLFCSLISLLVLVAVVVVLALTLNRSETDVISPLANTTDTTNTTSTTNTTNTTNSTTEPPSSPVTEASMIESDVSVVESTDSPSQYSPVVESTYSPSATMSADIESVFDDVLKFLNAADTDGSISVANSPQNMAYKWMTSDPNIRFYSDDTLTQRYALSTLYYSWGGDLWLNHGEWLSFDDECNWKGILCHEMGDVMSLDLCDNSMKGDIPIQLGLLSSMTFFNVSRNSLNGALPRALGGLRAIEVFDVSGNALSGTLPGPELGSLSNLQELYLHTNSFQGQIPSELGLIQGTIGPDSISNVEGGLRIIELQMNQFEGEVPDELSNLSSLTTLRIDYNELSGAIPSSLCETVQTSDTALYADCVAVHCPCCTYCCDSLISNGCKCAYLSTDLEFLC